MLQRKEEDTMRWFLLALLIIPAIEIGIFVWVGSMIGPWWVVILILLSAVLGITLAKKQGIETWMRATQSMNQGKMPGEQIIDGICIFIGAVLLFVPGFVTDILGLLLLIPFTRQPLKISIMNWIKWKINKGTVTFKKRK